MIGQSLSRYVIDSQLGEGGMGVVFKGRDTVLQRTVAIKILPPEKVADPERKRRFIQEAKAASALNHPNIITIFDIGSEQGRDFIVMEYVAGTTLDQLIPANGLPLTKALGFAIPIADALATAHRAGIIHRDLKPSNVMVTEAGTVKVLDFGVAKLVEPPESDDDKTRAAAGTQEGIAVGTPAYMSPEQAEGRRLDARSDIFSFGSVLYEMVTGRPAFSGSSALSVLAKILNDEPAPPSRLAAQVPSELEKTIQRCLRKDPDRRYLTMTDLKVVLEDLAESVASGTVPRPVAARSRRRWPWAAAALLAVLLAATTYVVRQRQEPRDAGAPMTAVPITSLSGQVRFPALSPDGDRVAFTWSGAAGDNTDIYVQQIGVGSPLRLTTDAAPDTGPAWSPDGRAIAFIRRVGSANTQELRTVPPLGGPERKLAEIHPRQPVYRPFTLAWCPESSCVIVADEQGEGKPDALFAIDFEGQRHQLTFPPSGAVLDTDPAVSPDGRSLIFRRDLTPFTGEMYRLALGKNVTPSGDPLRLTDITLSATRPAWLSDSREIVFSAKGNLWRMDALQGGVPTRLPFVGLDGNQPAISALRPGAESRLVYVRIFTDTNVWRVDTAETGAAASAPPRKVIASTRTDHFPALSPDQKRLAFFSARSGEFELWVSDPDGSNAVQLTSLKSLPGFPRWSPDSRTVTFHSDPEGHADVLTISADGGKPRIATPGPTIGGYPSFSRDGQFIYFTGPDPQGQIRIWKILVSGGTPMKITDTAGDIPVESYDGAHLYYVETAVRPSALWRLPTAGGPPDKLLDGVFNGTFDVAEKGIYYVEQEGTGTAMSAGDSRKGETRLRYYAFATRETVTIAGHLGQVAATLSASRDGRTIFFAQIDASADELMLVENFR